MLLLPVVDDSPPSGGLAELDPVLITNLVRVLWLLLDLTKTNEHEIQCHGTNKYTHENQSNIQFVYVLR